MRKYGWIPLVLVLALTLSTVSPLTVSAATTEPVVIALITTLTGEKANYGQWIRYGVELAAEEWNKKGGVLKRPIKVHLEDDQGMNAQTISAFLKVTQQVKPAAIFTSPYSTMVLALDPYIRKAGVPCFGGPTNIKITHTGNEWFFRLRPNDGIAGVLAAKFAVTDLRAKRIGIIHDSDEFGTGGAMIVEAYAKKFGAQVVGRHAYHTGDKDFSSQLLSLQRNGAQAIVAWGHAVEAGLIYQQKVNLGLVAVPIIGSPSWSAPYALELAGPAANGNYSITNYIWSNPSPRVQDFEKKHFARWKEHQDLHGTNYYDGFNMLMMAIEKAKSTDPEKIREAFRSIKGYQGVAATYDVTRRGDCTHEYSIVKIDGGKPVYLTTLKEEPFEPTPELIKMFNLPPLSQIPPLW
jgi:branched-chain amino acid transport system substrate-binding protein